MLNGVPPGCRNRTCTTEKVQSRTHATELQCKLIAARNCIPWFANRPGGDTRDDIRA